MAGLEEDDIVHNITIPYLENSTVDGVIHFLGTHASTGKTETWQNPEESGAVRLVTGKGFASQTSGTNDSRQALSDIFRSSATSLPDLLKFNATCTQKEGLGVDLGADKKLQITHYSIVDPQPSRKTAWVVEGWVGSHWATIDQRSDCKNGYALENQHEYQSYTFKCNGGLLDLTQSYRFIRIRSTSSDTTSLSRFELFGALTIAPPYLKYQAVPADAKANYVYHPNPQLFSGENLFPKLEVTTGSDLSEDPTPWVVATPAPVSTGASKVYKWQTSSSNTAIENNGTTFKNIGSDICWADAVSVEKFSSGSHTAVILINRAKEYGGVCSNTQVGFSCGSKNAYISGDGGLQVGSVSKSDISDLEFSEGNKITLTVDCDSKKFTWQVESKSPTTEPFPSDWSGEIGFFGKVIRNGDNLSFASGAVVAPVQVQTAVNYKWQTSNSNTAIENNGNTFKNIGSDICWADAVSVEKFSSGSHTAVILINRAKEYGGVCSNTQVGFSCGSKNAYISGDGGIQVGSVSKSDISDLEFSEGNKITLTVDCDSKKFTWQVESKSPTTEPFPSDWSGEIGFFGKVIRNGDNLSFASGAVVAPVQVQTAVNYKWQTSNSNTAIENNGTTFKNIGSDICWADAVSVEKFSSGSHTAVILINRAKEYGGVCSNTQVGFSCGSKNAYISGDGGLQVGSVSKSDISDLEFSEGNKITLTVDCDSKKFTWQVESKSPTTEPFPSDWSGEIGFFGKVIRNGDNLSFASGAAGPVQHQVFMPSPCWNSDSKYISSDMKTAENGKLVWLEKAGVWQCAGFKLPASGKYYFYFQITNQPNQGWQTPEVMFGVVESSATHNYSAYGHPGTGSHGLTTTQSGSYFKNSISYWEKWNQDDKTWVKVNCDKKEVHFGSKSGAKQKASFSTFSSDPVIVISMLSGAAVRVL